MAERASTQFDHANNFHRSTSSVGLTGADGEFSVTRAATALMHNLRGKKRSTTISPALWLFSYFVHPSGPRLAAPRWVKGSYSVCRVGMTLDLEERNSVQDEGEPPTQTRIYVSLSLSTNESLFDLIKYRFWSGEATSGVSRSLIISVRAAYSNSAP